MAHEHSVYDTDKHFSIDPATRELINQTPGKSCIMQYDHNSERISFDLPRVIEDHDMTLCNRVEVHYINIDSKTKEQTKDVYDVVDLEISPLEDTVATCSWLINRTATQRVGPLYFRIRFACISAYGEEEYAWHTAIYKGLSICDGISNTAYIAEEYSDILAEWDTKMIAWDERVKDLKDGGYYIPTVTQDDEGTMRISFEASMEGMEPVSDKTIELPEGPQGYTPKKGTDYFDGNDGYTPEKGKDYWTEQDKGEMVNDVKTVMTNVIVELTATYADGTDETFRLYGEVV